MAPSSAFLPNIFTEPTLHPFREREEERSICG
jgi:hypothetical protein